MSFFVRLLATGFGVGFAPILSGTLGSLVAIPIFFGLFHLNAGLYFLTTFAFTFFAVWVTKQALPFFQNAKKSGDPSAIVIDEIAGFLWSLGIMQYAGFCDSEKSPLFLFTTAFLLFRIFDVTKWWLVGWAERRLPGAWGVVMDDVAAGIFAGIFGVVACLLYGWVI